MNKLQYLTKEKEYLKNIMNNNQARLKQVEKELNEINNDEEIKKYSLNQYERRLAYIISKSRRKLTTSKLSKLSEFSYITTKKYLESLIKKAPVSKQTLGSRTYWYVKKD